MDWVEEFYTRQSEWSSVYSGNVSEGDRTRVAAIERLAGPGPKRVLELGAGGGQSAAATADLGHSVLGVELVAGAAANARYLASQPRKGTLEVVQGDFYEDQRRLLTRISGWLKVGGCALIDIYTP